MGSPYIYVVSVILGTLTGSWSGYSLIRQVSALSSSSSRPLLALTLLRLASLSFIAWHLLHWGPIPFILFGGSLMITKWIAILCLNK